MRTDGRRPGAMGHAGRAARLAALLAAASSCTQPATAPAPAPTPLAGREAVGRAADTVATRRAYVDGGGVIRWRDDDGEVALYGANYALPSSGDYRAAGRVTDDRKRLIDEDMAQFARMGWDGLRVAFWGDWQNADAAGNLIENDHLDLLDYLVARARERGIYILFNPIHTYDAGWPDAMGDSFPGFAARIPKARLGTDSAAIAAQVNYLRQILRHVNPYTGVALADEPAILFIEMINEPVHHPEDPEGSVRYIDALVDAVRSAGSDAITFHNVSQDFRIADAIRRSEAQGASFGWYPTGLNAGHELRGNHLRAVDGYPPMRMPALDGLPKLVYEFDSADQRTAGMYPAMARAFRAGGAQFAAMFAYDMLATASRNLGWQTHYLNLVYTPRKAMSAVIAAEAMRRLPRLVEYGAYPANTTFGPFRIGYDPDRAEMVTGDAFLNAGATATVPPDPARLRRVAGYGSSPVVAYEGLGAYFLDRVRPGVWRLEVYPDAVPVADPFERPSPARPVTRALFREWPMTIDLPDLGPAFSVQPIARGNDATTRAAGGRFVVRPGVYVLGRHGPVDPATLPAALGRLRFDEYHVPAPDTLPVRVLPATPPQHVAGPTLEVGARVVADAPPDSVTLWLAPAGRRWFRPFAMRRVGPYRYAASVPPEAIPEGVYDYRISVREGGRVTTFPGAVSGGPADWDYAGREAWRIVVVGEATPLRLLDPASDVDGLSFTRIGDGWREGIFRLVPSGATGEPAFHLELPVGVDGITPEDYRASLVVKDRIDARGAAIGRATAVRLRLRGVGPRQTLRVTLVEEDGTGWSAPVDVGPGWTERTIPVTDLVLSRAANLPMGFPGHWNYWLEPADGRGGPGDAIRLPDVERLQLSLTRPEGVELTPGSYGVEVESVTLLFEASP